jgi:hypothetical protein
MIRQGARILQRSHLSDIAEGYVQLSDGDRPKRAYVREFKGQQLFHIREYYQENSEWKPTKKGITLKKDELKVLLDNIQDLNNQFK